MRQNSFELGNQGIRCLDLSVSDVIIVVFNLVYCFPALLIMLALGMIVNAIVLLVFLLPVS